MKRQKHLSKSSNTLWIGVGSAIVIIIILIIAFSGNKTVDVKETDTIEQNLDDTQVVFEEPEPLQGETVEALKEETTPVESKKIGEEGLCEDYFFEQGDSLHILDHEIIVDRIGKDALRLRVDGQNYVMNDDESDYLGEGIRLSIAEDKILYFSADDPSNAVIIRVGCNYDVNPNEKYVEGRGKNICRELYADCQSAFGIDLE